MYLMHTRTPAVISTQTHVQMIQVHMVDAIRLQLVVMPCQRQVAHAVPAGQKNILAAIEGKPRSRHICLY